MYRLVWVEFYRYEKVQKEVLSKSTFSDAQYNKSKSIFILAKKKIRIDFVILFALFLFGLQAIQYLSNAENI